MVNYQRMIDTLDGTDLKLFCYSNNISFLDSEIALRRFLKQYPLSEPMKKELKYISTFNFRNWLLAGVVYGLCSALMAFTLILMLLYTSPFFLLTSGIILVVFFIFRSILKNREKKYDQFIKKKSSLTSKIQDLIALQNFLSVLLLPFLGKLWRCE